MSGILLTLAALSAFVLWRDLSSGRIYYARKHGSLDYDAPEQFFEKGDSPSLFWTVVVTIAVCCLIALTLGILSLFIPEEHLGSNESLFLLFAIPIAVLVLYLTYGLLGRAFSWVKNYGSLDKKW